MAAAWHGGLAGADQFINDTTVLNATSRAMDWWFANDFTNPVRARAPLRSTCSSRADAGVPRQRRKGQVPVRHAGA